MSIPQYKPGDKVWVKFRNTQELPDEVLAWEHVPTEYVSWCENHPSHYFVSLKDNVGACTIMLRPRYDGNEKIDWSKCVWNPEKVTV